VDGGAREIARALGAEALAWAVAGGEDYELLLTCDAAEAEALANGLRRATGATLTVIGEIEGLKAGVVFVDAADSPWPCGRATSTSVHSLSSLELLSLVALLLISALLTGAEAAYFSLGRARLKRLAEERGSGDSALQPLLRRPHDLLVTLLVGRPSCRSRRPLSPPPSRPRCSAPWACPSPSAP